MIIIDPSLPHQECGKGGEGIDDLPGILNEAVPATSHNLNMTIQETIASADRLTVLVEKIQGGEIESKELDVNVMKVRSRVQSAHYRN